METNKRLPDDFQEITGGMSNFDHTIEPDFAERLQSGAFYGRHFAWNFCGKVWYENGFFYSEIWQYNFYETTLQSESLEGLMEITNDRFGCE